MRFDPMTGEPIEDGAPQTNGQQVNGQQPNMQQPYAQPVYANQMQPPRKKNSWVLPAVIGGLSAILVMMVAAVVILGGLFLSNSMKVANAFVKTFEEKNAITEVLIPMSEILLEKENTIYVEGEVSGAEVKAEYRNTKKDKQLWVVAEIPNIPEIEGTATLTKEELQVASPIAGNKVFYYNYKQDNNGYLVNNMGAENIELLNKALEAVYSGDVSVEMDKESEKELKEATEKLLTWYKEIEFKKVEKASFTVDGKNKNCVGYQVVITEDLIKDGIDIFGEILEAYAKGMGVPNAETYVNSYINELETSFNSTEDAKTTFYLSGNKLAAIVVEVGYSKVEVLFEGGDYRYQNVSVLADGQRVLKIDGQKEGATEVFEMEFVGAGEVSYEYDTKTGDFEFVVESTSGSELMSIEMVIVNQGNKVAFEDGEFAIDGEKMDFALSVRKGADIVSLDGERVDVGNASETELQNALMAIYSQMY